MELIDNLNHTWKEDLVSHLKAGSRVSIVAACFSMYAYRELKKQLDRVDNVRFVYSSPTFVEEQEKKQHREFYIPRLDREKSLYGTEFEIKLKNEMTQKSISYECADWIRGKAAFKSNTTHKFMQGFCVVENKDGTGRVYMPVNGFTTVDLGCEKGNTSYTMMYAVTEPALVDANIKIFDHLWNNPDEVQDVTETVINQIESAYAENSPELIYFMALYNIFSEFLEDISEDELPNEATGFKNSKIWSLLYDFQRDAAIGIINKLERYNGCILADSVGLGKTFTALAVIKYYESRNKTVLVLCPKKLAANWNTYKDNYVNNPIASDRLNYDVLYHTDLSRDHGTSNGLDLGRLNWGNYDLVVIDESHNFRNGGQLGDDGKENRYVRLMNRVIRSGVKTKVLMLSATPVNNKFTDLKNQLQLAYEGRPEEMDQKLNTVKPINEIFKDAQAAYNSWTRLPAEERTTQALLDRMDFDFFELLDSVTIARSRNHIRKYYDAEKIGSFPHRRKPVSIETGLTDLPGAVTYDDIYQLLSQLNLAIYVPSDFLLPSKREKYEGTKEGRDAGLTQVGREMGIRRLMGINLLKRLESSVHSFVLTLTRVEDYIGDTIRLIEDFKAHRGKQPLPYEVETDLDLEDEDSEDFVVGRKVPISLADMDYLSWERALKADLAIIHELLVRVGNITPDHDLKLQTLLSEMEKKVQHPFNPGNRKMLIFSAFADTADYLYEHIASHFKKRYGLDSALVTGSTDGKSTIPRIAGDFNTILTLFSPVSKDRDALSPGDTRTIDILIATDCISEGQNLQDADCVVNYDIHWNPVRLIQRFGRIDRIGSHNKEIQMVNFWPDVSLDEYINLKARVEARMKISIMTASGDDNPLTPEEEGDLAYRKAQLKKLKEEVVDMEDMTSGVSIMDLGLNDFRMDLLEYVKTHEEIEHLPHGLHAVVPAEQDMPPGIIFVLRNVNQNVNIDHQNRIHPFYMVYMADDGDVVCGYLQPKQLLDTLRKLCRGRNEPVKAVCSRFNAATKDGKDMHRASTLLGEAIHSIVDEKEESDIDSLFSSGGTSALVSDVKGLDDFELICFLVVMGKDD